MNASQKEQLFSNLAEAMQGVPERIVDRQLLHFYIADPNYGRGVAAELGLDMQRYVPWTKLSLAELIEKTAELGQTPQEFSRLTFTGSNNIPRSSQRGMFLSNHCPGILTTS